jgi:hypothetical protein
MSIYGDDAAERKMFKVFTVLCHYFPKAIREVTRVCVGNAQHNPGEPLHWARGKSMDQMNALFHHMVDHELGEVFDKTDSPEVLAAVGGKPLYSMAKGAWRALAELELAIEREEAKAAPNIGVEFVNRHEFRLPADASLVPICQCGVSLPYAQNHECVLVGFRDRILDPMPAAVIHVR